MEGLGLGNNKGYVIAISIALIFVAALVTGYYVWTRGPPEPYSEISLLDANGKAENYPELVIIGENNTFNVAVNVVNHMGKTLPFEVRVKITQQASPVFPVQGSRAYFVNVATLENGGKWNTTATATIDDSGNYMVVYELWAQNENSGALEFTGNACVLNIEAINQT
jgi:uncharacterized membrane protein